MDWCTTADINAVWDYDLTTLPSGVAAAAISMSSATIEAHLRSRFNLPISVASVPRDLALVCARLSAWQILNYLGFQPAEGSADSGYRSTLYEAPMAYLRTLQQSGVHPDMGSMSDRPYLTFSGNSRQGQYSGTVINGAGAVIPGPNRNRGW